MSQTVDWKISGANSQTILGTTYIPDGPPVGCVIIAHGFKGYKDFRMIPAFARGLRRTGFVAHAFNFSHSGMTANPDTFERPDLFELDTWNKQVFDIKCVVQALDSGKLTGAGLPYVLLGHSRGGVSAIFFAARQAAEPRFPQPAGLINAGSPAYASGLAEPEKQALRDKGYLDSPSARTGQNLRIGFTWLAEQEADPEAHDVLGSIRQIKCPILVVHGDNDETINVESAASIASAAANAHVVRIKNCSHVFNTPNPPPHDFLEILELARAVEEIVKFSRDCCVAGA